MRRPRTLAPLVATLTCLLALLIAAPAGASAAKPIKGKPKIVDIEGFVYPTDASLENWRAGALFITRYPKILPSDFPGRIRKLLSFRAIGGLKVFDHGTRIASRTDEGGLPVAVEGRSVYYAHLLIATQKQSDRIFHAYGLERPIAKGWPSAGNIRTKASAQVRVKAKGRTIARSGTKGAQAVTLAGAADPPWVVNGCVIRPHTSCPGMLLGATDLSGADLSYSDLAGTDFGYADLNGTNFEHADLEYAGLYNTDLRYADLYGANVKGADFSGACFSDTVMPDGSVKDDC